MIPPSVSIMTQFHKFFLSLLESGSLEVQVSSRILVRDIQTNLGANLTALKEETGLDPWIFGRLHLKHELLKFNTEAVPECDHWRLAYLGKILIQRTYAYFNGLEEAMEIEALINSLVST